MTAKERIVHYLQASPTYYFACGDEVKIGTVYRARDRRKYPHINNVTVDKVLEMYRPENMIPHHSALFMTDTTLPRHLIRLGVDWTYLYEVEPLGVVEKHNMGWADQIHWLLANDGLRYEDRRVKNATLKYWQGKPYPKRRLQRWEYLTTSFRFIRLAAHNPYED